MGACLASKVDIRELLFSLPLISSFAYLSTMASFSLARSKVYNWPMRMGKFFKNFIVVAHATLLILMEPPGPPSTA